MKRKGCQSPGLKRGRATTGGLSFRRPRGCVECIGTGYKGRIGIFEVMSVSENLRDLILATAGKKALQAEAVKSGMQPLQENAREKIAAGLTTPEEFLASLGL